MWRGMYINNPFDMSEAVFVVFIDGVRDLGTDIGHSFPLHTNEPEETTWETVSNKIQQHYPLEKNKLIRINLEDGLTSVSKFKKKHSFRSTYIDHTYIDHTYIHRSYIHRSTNKTFLKSNSFLISC